MKAKWIRPGQLEQMHPAARAFFEKYADRIDAYLKRTDYKDGFVNGYDLIRTLDINLISANDVDIKTSAKFSIFSRIFEWMEENSRLTLIGICDTLKKLYSSKKNDDIEYTKRRKWVENVDEYNVDYLDIRAFALYAPKSIKGVVWDKIKSIGDKHLDEGLNSDHVINMYNKRILSLKKANRIAQSNYDEFVTEVEKHVDEVSPRIRNLVCCVIAWMEIDDELTIDEIYKTLDKLYDNKKSKNPDVIDMKDKICSIKYVPSFDEVKKFTSELGSFVGLFKKTFKNILESHEEEMMTEGIGMIDESDMIEINKYL